MNNIEAGQKVIVTTDNWFFAPDGRSYRAIFGTVRAIRSSEETLGVRTNAKSTNWYAEIGNVTVAGCQIHYAVRCDKAPPLTVDDHSIGVDGIKSYLRPSHIYNADEGAA